MTGRENMLRAYHHEQPQYVPNGFLDFDIMDSFGERYFGEGTGDDWFGVNWTYTPELHSQTETPGQELLKDLEGWQEKISMPDLDSYDWEQIAQEITAGWDREHKVSLCMLLNGPFERMMSLMGFENAMCAFYETPDEVKELFEAITEHKCRYIRILKKYFQLDIVAFHDDWGNNQNMFFSMDMWREFIKPCIQRVIDAVHEEGMIFEMHSCGYIKPTIPELVEMGIDSIQPLQYCNQVEEIKERFGDQILLSGGFRTQDVLEKPGASEAEIRGEVRRTLNKLAKDGGYCALAPIIDDKVREIVIDEVSKYGKEFYHYA
ncbi:MAG: hypothetical protein HFI76_03515 [Lachnospiraceae bacterium]|nr:hypothetical protein [Lachnospiraceae bacterium]